MEHLLRFLEIIAWPSTVLVLAFTFRSELRGIVARVTSLKYKDWEATFERDIAPAEKKIGTVFPSTALPDKGRARLERLSEASPRAAILEAWIEMEQVLSSLAKAHSIDPRSPLQTLRELEALGVISPDLAESFRSLRRLRNKAAHVSDFAVEKQQAQRYINLASGMGLLLRKANDIQPHGPPHTQE